MKDVITESQILINRLNRDLTKISNQQYEKTVQKKILRMQHKTDNVKESLINIKARVKKPNIHIIEVVEGYQMIIQEKNHYKRQNQQPREKKDNLT